MRQKLMVAALVLITAAYCWGLGWIAWGFSRAGGTIGWGLALGVGILLALTVWVTWREVLFGLAAGRLVHEYRPEPGDQEQIEAEPSAAEEQQRPRSPSLRIRPSSRRLAPPSSRRAARTGRPGSAWRWPTTPCVTGAAPVPRPAARSRCDGRAPTRGRPPRRPSPPRPARRRDGPAHAPAAQPQPSARRPAATAAAPITTTRKGARSTSSTAATARAPFLVV